MKVLFLLAAKTAETLQTLKRRGIDRDIFLKKQCRSPGNNVMLFFISRF